MYGLTTLHCVFPPVFPNVCVDMYSIPRSAFDTMLVMRIHPFAVAASLAFHGCAPAEKDAIASGSLLEELDPEMTDPTEPPTLAEVSAEMDSLTVDMARLAGYPADLPVPVANWTAIDIFIAGDEIRAGLRDRLTEIGATVCASAKTHIAQAKTHPMFSLVLFIRITGLLSYVIDSPVTPHTERAAESMPVLIESLAALAGQGPITRAIDEVYVQVSPVLVDASHQAKLYMLYTTAALLTAV